VKTDIYGMFSVTMWWAQATLQKYSRGPLGYEQKVAQGRWRQGTFFFRVWGGRQDEERLRAKELPNLWKDWLQAVPMCWSRGCFYYTWKIKVWPDTVVHTCNPSYSEGGHQECRGSSPIWQKVSETPSQPISQKRWSHCDPSIGKYR
jgi:hypothetical protein